MNTELLDKLVYAVRASTKLEERERAAEDNNQHPKKSKRELSSRRSSSSGRGGAGQSGTGRGRRDGQRSATRRTSGAPWRSRQARNADKRVTAGQSLHFLPKPSFHGYQLIGDSLLLRFSLEMLKGSVIVTDQGLRYEGYCVSGQTIRDLLTRLKSGFYPLAKKIVLMIGTNDLLKNSSLDNMKHDLRKVVEYIRLEAEELILLTLPPIPLLQHSDQHWLCLNNYNQFMKDLSRTGPCFIHPLNIFDLFCERKIKKCRMQFFELFYSKNGRKDMIHFNKKGLSILIEELSKKLREQKVSSHLDVIMKIVRREKVIVFTDRMSSDLPALKLIFMSYGLGVHVVLFPAEQDQFLQALVKVTGCAFHETQVVVNKAYLGTYDDICHMGDYELQQCVNKLLQSS